MATPKCMNDVYASAVTIQNQLEELIREHGRDIYSDLYDAITNVLMRLETLVNQYDSYNVTIDELNSTIEQLDAEKKKKALEGENYQKDIELQEESWHTNAKTQKELIAQLQIENRKLNDVLKRKVSDAADEDRMRSREEELEEEIANYKERLQRERDALKLKECAIIHMDTELSEMNSTLERERVRCLEYKCRMSVSREQVNNLIAVKSQLEAQLLDNDFQLSRIRSRINRDSGCSDELLTDTELSAEDLSLMIQRLAVSGKMVIDLDDCEQPHLTLSELHKTLSERNQLKKQVLSIQEELAQFRPDSVDGEDVNVEDDPPVQGPINREPDEKLFPERFTAKESFMKRLFEDFFVKIESRIRLNKDSSDSD